MFRTLILAALFSFFLLILPSHAQADQMYAYTYWGQEVSPLGSPVPGVYNTHASLMFTFTTPTPFSSTKLDESPALWSATITGEPGAGTPGFAITFSSLDPGASVSVWLDVSTSPTYNWNFAIHDGLFDAESIGGTGKVGYGEIFGLYDPANGINADWYDPTPQGTWTGPTPVPEPSSFPLFIIGLSGLLAFKLFKTIATA